MGENLVKAFEEECKKRKLRGVLTYAYNNEKVLNFFRKNKYNIGHTVVECNKVF